MTHSANPSPTHVALDHLAEQAASRADEAIAATRQSTNRAFDALHEALHATDDGAEGLLPASVGRVIDRGEAIARNGLDQVRSAGRQVGAQAGRAGDRLIDGIRHDPVKSVLIAAAAGAAIAGLVGLLARPSAHRD